MEETQIIAEYECKKALTKIHDDVYVVAFFCPEITPSSGSESFNGLLGMILEIAIPKIYATWVAHSKNCF